MKRLIILSCLLYIFFSCSKLEATFKFIVNNSECDNQTLSLSLVSDTTITDTLYLQTSYASEGFIVYVNDKSYRVSISGAQYGFKSDTIYNLSFNNRLPDTAHNLYHYRITGITLIRWPRDVNGIHWDPSRWNGYQPYYGEDSVTKKSIYGKWDTLFQQNIDTAFDRIILKNAPDIISPISITSDTIARYKEYLFSVQTPIIPDGCGFEWVSDSLGTIDNNKTSKINLSISWNVDSTFINSSAYIGYKIYYKASPTCYIQNTIQLVIGPESMVQSDVFEIIPTNDNNYKYFNYMGLEISNIDDYRGFYIRRSPNNKIYKFYK